jgi:hypothetical protein
MKKLFLIIFLFLLTTNISTAKPVDSAVKPLNVNFEADNFTTISTNTPEYKNLLVFMSNYDCYINSHNAKELQKLYSPDYVNADGIDLTSLLKLLNDTWKAFPDIKFVSKIREIRINNNYAAVETFDIAKGNAGKVSELTKDFGELTGNSKTIIYLKKSGNNWKIISDKILYEKTYLRYGKAKIFKLDLTSPEQVYAGTDYTATVLADLPKGTVALASITSEPIVYPQTQAEEVFRQIPIDYGVLERVMKANTTNNNELNVASIGCTELVGNNYQNPQIKLVGMILIMQRVNVIPRSAFVHKTEKTKTKL